MKFTTNKKTILKTLIIVLYVYFNLSFTLGLKTTFESERNLEEEFDPEIEAELRVESENLENLFNTFNFMELKSGNRNSTNSNSQNKYTIDLNNPTSDLSGWFGVSNPKFIDPNNFPSEISNSKDTVDFQKVESENFIVNKQYPSSEDKDLKNKLMFFFRFKNGVVYFTATKKSMNILSSLKPIKAENNNLINHKINANQTCFYVHDESDMTWNLCADNIEIKKKWLCSLEKYTNSYMEDYCNSENGKGSDNKNNNSNNNSTNANNKKQKKIQNILIIPTESRKCNEKWNYLEHGNDWECTCSEGKKQSPIDLPTKNQANQSKIKPLFMYESILPISKENTLDGLLVENEPVKIYHKNGALHIFHNYMGKVVTNDGAVFHGEEIVFHTPSEHTIDGRKFDLEVQVIHYGKSKGDIANQVVLSFLFYEKPGVFNKFFEKLDYYNLPNEIDTYRDLKERLFIPDIFYKNEENDLNHMKDFSFYSYEGSLTFPPCTERTTYYVAAKPLPMSSTVIGLFKEALRKPDYISPEGKIVKSFDQIKLNNRLVQPRNGRKIHYYQSQLKGLNQ